MILDLAAWVYLALAGLAIVFQLGLAVGMPWGNVAMGGRYPGKFPHHMRGAAVVQAVLLAALAGVVLVRAGWLLDQWFELSRTLIWFVVGFAGLSVILNVTTPSKWERRIWGPITILMLMSSIAVAVA